MTRREWAEDFLEGVGAPVTRRTLLVMLSWMQAEGGTARWNPLNTTHEAPGATDYNWVGVKNYPDFKTGLDANVETLVYGAERKLNGYRLIRHRLKANMGALRTLHAVETSNWGTGGLAKKVLAMIRVGANFKKYSEIEVFPS